MAFTSKASSALITLLGAILTPGRLAVFLILPLLPNLAVADTYSPKITWWISATGVYVEGDSAFETGTLYCQQTFNGTLQSVDFDYGALGWVVGNTFQVTCARPAPYYTWSQGGFTRGECLYGGSRYEPYSAPAQCINAPSCPVGQQRNAQGLCTVDGVPTAKNVGCPDTCTSGKPEENPISVGNPIHTGIGNKYQIEVDYRGDGVFPLVLKRTYNSQTPVANYSAQSTLGKVWQHTYDRRIEYPYPSTSWAKVIREDGRFYTFRFLNGQATYDADVNFKLAWLGSSGAVITTEDGSQETYDYNGRLVSIKNRAGATQTLTYSGGRLYQVIDPTGRTLTFGYDGINRLITVTDPAGGVYGYTYDNTTNNNVVKVTYPDGKFKTYVYNEPAYTSGANLPNALTGIVDENGTRFATFKYDSANRALSTEHAGGTDWFAVAYNSDGTRTVTDPLGTSRTYGFQTTLGVRKNTGITEPCISGCTTKTLSQTFDANGNLASRTDFRGVQTTYQYDLTRNLETSRTEAVGSPEARTITTRWHASFRLPTQITEPGRTTTFTYDAAGNRLTKTITAGGQSRTWSYTYNSFGQVTSVDGPRTDVSDVATLTYDTSGNLTSITNALGHVTTYGNYDAHGRVGRITDPNGVITDLTYDVRGRLISRTVDGKTTTFEYDGVGQLTKVPPPDGAYLQYTYDAAHRLTDITDALGNRIHTTYDLAGHKTKEEVFDPANTLVRTHQWVYDTLSRLSQSIGAAGQTTALGYDANGNRTSITDPLNRVTTYAYDALNRLVSETDPLSGSTGYSYDALDHLLAVTDPANLTTSYSYNGFGDLLQETSPNTGTTHYTYDSAGNRLTRTDANGTLATSSYDALNRLTGIDYPGTASDVTYSYDQGAYGLGRLTQLGDSQTSTDFAYSPTGAVLSQTLKETASGLTQGTIAYQYDAADLLTRITYNALHQVDYARAVNGQVQTITQTTGGGPVETLASDIQYQPFGPLQSLTYGNGLVWTRSFDLDGRLTGQTTGTLQSLAYAYDPVGNLTGLTDALNSAHSQSFGYDALDRLVSAAGPYGTLTYTYDPTGNRQSEIHDANTTHYQYGLTDQRLQAQTGAVTKTYAYDAAGHTLQAGTTEFVYGANGRLSQAKQGSTVLADYGYDALGRRVTKTVTGQTRYFSFDLDGKLLADENAYVYLDDRPLVQLDSLGNPSYLHPNHLGAPLKATNETGTVVWAADSEPFGKTSLVNPSVSVNLRLPGQYYDAETGLHYNYFRDYDPSLGRYLESDPIGLKGGINTYAYVGNNPINWVDPLGLESAKYNVPTPPFVFPPGSPEYNATAKALDGLSDAMHSDAMHDAVDSIYNAKPPKNAYNPNGPKAPGKPRPENGFEDPKDGENWVPNPYPGKGGSSHGWQDSKGRVWCPTGQGGRAHGGRHWDVQLPGGRNINVRPEDNINDLL